MFDGYSSSAINFCSESSPGGKKVDGLPTGPNFIRNPNNKKHLCRKSEVNNFILLPTKEWDEFEKLLNLETPIGKMKGDRLLVF